MKTEAVQDLIAAAVGLRQVIQKYAYPVMRASTARHFILSDTYIDFVEASNRTRDLITRTEIPLRKLEVETAREIAAIFREQRDIVVAGFENFRRYFREELEDQLFFLLGHAFLQTDPRFRDILMRPSVEAREIAREGIAAQLGLKLSFKENDPASFTWLQQNAAWSVANVNDITRDRIRTIISDGYRDGKSYSAIANEIKEEFDAMAAPASQAHIRTRAELIAVTEIRKAHEDTGAAIADQLKDMGINQEKSWGGPEDSHTCDICQDNIDQGWIPMDTLFRSGHLHAPAHPGCRHRTLYRRVKQGTMPQIGPRPGDRWDVQFANNEIVIRPISV